MTRSACHDMRAARPKTLPHRLSTSRAMMRGVFTTPRRVEHGLPRSAFARRYPAVTVRSGAEHCFEFVPVRVVTRGRSLSHARHAIAQADVARVPTGIAELGEAAILPGDDELGRQRRKLSGRHSLK